MPAADHLSSLLAALIRRTSCRAVIHSLIEFCYREADQKHAPFHVQERWRALGQHLTTAEEWAARERL